MNPQSVAMIADIDIGAAPIHVKEDLRIDRYAHYQPKNVISCDFGWLVGRCTHRIDGDRRHLVVSCAVVYGAC
jgi:hypothetical protein